jgi:gliding motility-associated-like protein
MIRKTILFLFFLFKILPAIQAQCGSIDFVTTNQKGCVPFIVKFVAKNYPTGSEFSWDMGSGYSSQSTADSFKVSVFTNIGSFNVSLKVTIPGGQVCTIVKNNFITVNRRPVANFSIDKSVLCYGGDTVTFTDQSLNTNSRDWVIDGVLYPNGPRVLKHFIRLSGYKSVSLRVRDTLGCDDVINLDSAIHVLDSPSVTIMASDSNGCVPLNVSFTPLINGLNGQTITSYSWTLNGSSKPGSSLNNPSVTYSAPGSYDVKLTITTSGGCTYTIIKPGFIITGNKPNLSFQADHTAPCKNQLVRLINTTPGTHLPGKITWTIDSGTIVAGTVNSDTIYIQYTAAGSFPVQLDYYYNGCASSKRIPNFITIQPFKADFYSSDTALFGLPDTVHMVNTSIVPPTGTNSYYWILYDLDKNSTLATSTAKDPDFIINKYGHFDIRLIVVNSNGCSDTLRLNDYIFSRKLGEKFSADHLMACTEDTIHFFSGAVHYSYPVKWIFYDLDGITLLKSDTSHNTYMVYSAPGDYTVSLIINPGTSAADTTTRKKYIHIGNPIADFTISGDGVECVNSHITFLEATEPNIPTLDHIWIILHTDSPNVILTGAERGPGGNIYPLFTVPGVYNVYYKAKNSISNCADSIVKNGYVKISGIKGVISADKTSDCKRATVNFSAQTIYNFHYRNISDLVSYEWLIDTIEYPHSSSDFQITDRNGQLTSIRFIKSGDYKVNCRFTNSDGCSYFDTSNAILVHIGTETSFLLDSGICLNEMVKPVNRTNRTDISYKWFSDSSVTFNTSDTAREPEIIFHSKGSHALGLIASNSMGCIDTFISWHYVSKPVASFRSNDTVNICSPALIHFSAEHSPDSSLYQWNFGDGSPELFTTDTSIGHFFAIKNGKSSFDIRLITVNRFGCRDTMFKPGYINFLGPVPYFKMHNNKGCEPLHVQFEDSSRNVSRFYFSYGTGPVDSISIHDTVYHLSSPAALYTVYRPYVFAFNEFGTCTQFFQPEDSIVVYRNPDAGFTAADRISCTPFSVAFKDTSAGAVKWKWDFENDGIIDDTLQNPVHVYNKAGIYSVRLIIENQFGCTDTMLSPGYIESRPKPSARFKISDSVVCHDMPVVFTNQSASDNPLIRYHWDFGISGRTDDTSDARNPLPFTYDLPGAFSVSLRIEDINGCSDTFTYPVKIIVRDTLPPPPPSIGFISVENDKDIRIVWNSGPAADFNAYALERRSASTFDNIASVPVWGDTMYVDISGINVKTQPYSYRLNASNQCGITSAYSGVHTSIFLNATTFSQNSNLITWTPYSGWSLNEYKYLLYRSAQYAGPYSLRASLSSADTAFKDDGLCDSAYYYYVEAVHLTKGFISKSNIDFNRAPFSYPVLPLELTRATVINDRQVLVEWDTVSGASINKKEYLLERMNNGGSWDFIASTPSGSYIDNTVDVHNASYIYKVELKDYCGNHSPGSNFGKSILLRTPSLNMEDFSVLLTWNTYMDWANTVDHYEIDFLDLKTGMYSLLGYVRSSDSSYTDKIFHKTDSPWTYRVRAIEAVQAVPDTSTSNLAGVLLPPKLFIPNAFSPNNDGVNDIFNVKGIFIRNNTGNPLIDFRLRIYDRWGELLFESNDMNMGWNGDYLGKPAEPGTYIYEVNAMGFNRERFNLKGTFHLLR